MTLQRKTRHLIPVAAVIGLIALIAGCADTADYINEHPHRVGAPIVAGTAGLMAGSAIGSSAAEAGLGLGGVAVGVVAAPYLEKRDTVFFDKAIDKAAVAPRGQPVEWSNPNTGTTGKMTRLNEVDLQASSTCRVVRSEVTTASEIATEDLIVCRDDSTPWYIESAELVERRPRG